MNSKTKIRIYILASSVVCLLLASFFVLTQSKEKPIESPDILYRNSNLGFSIHLSKNWQGKYEVRENLNSKRVREIAFVYSEIKDNPAKIFSVLIYPEKYWDDIRAVELKKNEIKRANGMVYVWQLGPENPYNGPELEHFSSIQKQVQKIMSSFNLTGEYASRTVKLFFHPNQENDCGKTASVSRVLDYGPDYEALALKELFSGPVESDLFYDVNSPFSKKTNLALIGSIIRDNVFYLNLSDIRKDIATSSICSNEQVYVEIENTIKQFGINKFVVYINGDPQIFYDWMQKKCLDDTCRHRPF